MQWIVQLFSLILIHWIEIYGVDSALDGISQRLDNWGLVQLFMVKIKFIFCTT